MRRPRPVVAVVGIAVVVVLAGSVATIAVRAGRSSSKHPTVSAGATPAQVSRTYYQDLHDQDAAAAFALLCPAQQTQGEGAFAQTLGLDGSTGTGISSFTVTGDSTIDAGSASVPASVTLDNGQSLPIDVLLTSAAAGWQVCSSNLGGVLPSPGSSAAPSSAV